MLDPIDLIFREHSPSLRPRPALGTLAVVENDIALLFLIDVPAGKGQHRSGINLLADCAGKPLLQLGRLTASLLDELVILPVGKFQHLTIGSFGVRHDIRTFNRNEGMWIDFQDGKLPTLYDFSPFSFSGRR